MRAAILLLVRDAVSGGSGHREATLHADERPEPESVLDITVGDTSHGRDRDRNVRFMPAHEVAETLGEPTGTAALDHLDVRDQCSSTNARTRSRMAVTVGERRTGGSPADRLAHSVAYRSPPAADRITMSRTGPPFVDEMMSGARGSARRRRGHEEILIYGNGRIRRDDREEQNANSKGVDYRRGWREGMDDGR